MAGNISLVIIIIAVVVVVITILFPDFLFTRSLRSHHPWSIVVFSGFPLLTGLKQVWPSDILVFYALFLQAAKQSTSSL